MSDLLGELVVSAHREAERTFVFARRAWEDRERSEYPSRDDGIAEGLARALVSLGRGTTEELRREAQVAALAALDVGELGPARARRALRLARSQPSTFSHAKGEVPSGAK